jgi:hypothetical protein
MMPSGLFLKSNNNRHQTFSYNIGSTQTICQNLDNPKPENRKSIESNVFASDTVPVNVLFHSCIQRLISPNITLCDNYGLKNSKGPILEQLMLYFLE